MDDKFLFGLALGMLGGAVIATNSLKARNAVKQGPGAGHRESQRDAGRQEEETGLNENRAELYFLPVFYCLFSRRMVQ